MINRTAEEYEAIVQEELHVKAPMWVGNLVQALGVIEPFAHGHATFNTPDDVERAAIRLAVVCQSFEEMLGLERGEMLEHLDEIYDVVAEKSENMSIAAGFHWADPVEDA